MGLDVQPRSSPTPEVLIDNDDSTRSKSQAPNIFRPIQQNQSNRPVDRQILDARKTVPKTGNVKYNRMKISANIPTEEDLIAMKKKKKVLPFKN